MTAVEAREIAKKSLPSGISITQCFEFEGYYAFSIDYVGVSLLTPDMPTLKVSKKTGEIGYMENDQPYFDEKKQEWIDPFADAKEIDI